MELYYRPGSAAFAPRVMLEEVGAPYRLIQVARDHAAQPAGYEQLNPHRRVPTLVDGDLVVSESAAVLMHLADSFPEAGLAPAVGTPERASWYRWMTYLTNTVQATMMIWFYPERFTTDPEGIDAVQQQAAHDLAAMLQIVEAAIEGREYLLDAFSTADIYLFMLTDWGADMQPAWPGRPGLGRHYRLVGARPAVQRALADEG